MLFYLTDSLIVNKDDDRYNDIFKCVRNLTIAADECQHELMGDIHVLEHWKGLFANDPCRAVLLNLINNFSTTSVPSYITEYVEIVLENPQNRSYGPDGNSKIYQLTYDNFISCESALATHLIGEFDYDSQFYGHILNWYKTYKNISANTNYIPVGGGGNSTSHTFKAHIDRKHISVCIVDNDKRYHGASDGKTATDCRNVPCMSPLSRLKVIDVLEIENLIPKDIIDSLTWNNGHQENKTAFDGLYDNIPDKNNLRYVDLKLGYTKHQNFSQDSQWVSFVKYCCECNPELSDEIRNNFDYVFNNAADEVRFMPRLSKTLLKDSLHFLDTHPGYNPTSLLPFQLHEWRELGQITLNTCICRNSETLNI